MNTVKTSSVIGCYCRTCQISITNVIFTNFLINTLMIDDRRLCTSFYNYLSYIYVIVIHKNIT